LHYQNQQGDKKCGNERTYERLYDEYIKLLNQSEILDCRF
jgi:hypothetical protein